VAAAVDGEHLHLGPRLIAQTTGLVPEGVVAVQLQPVIVAVSVHMLRGSSNSTTYIRTTKRGYMIYEYLYVNNYPPSTRVAKKEPSIFKKKKKTNGRIVANSKNIIALILSRNIFFRLRYYKLANKSLF
jgi:hypothetical protein